MAKYSGKKAKIRYSMDGYCNGLHGVKRFNTAKQVTSSPLQVPGQCATSSVLLGSATPVSSSSFSSELDLASVNALFCSVDPTVSSSVVGDDQILGMSLFFANPCPASSPICRDAAFLVLFQARRL
ncbi:unnamed protein product [Lupinus luteus]|uniref:Uncharacterized protein n=1 Tax=Lupinus luteus TaxID=3873 RepID=A0AAV1XDR8_LUPLU